MCKRQTESAPPDTATPMASPGFAMSKLRMVSSTLSTKLDGKSHDRARNLLRAEVSEAGSESSTPHNSVGAERALTIYNQNFAAVRDTVPLELKAGSNRVQYASATVYVETAIGQIHV